MLGGRDTTVWLPVAHSARNRGSTFSTNNRLLRSDDLQTKQSLVIVKYCHFGNKLLFLQISMLKTLDFKSQIAIIFCFESTRKPKLAANKILR